MPSILSCSCGKSMQVPDKYAGKRVRCPGCSEAVFVPHIEASEESSTARELLDDSAPTARRRPREEGSYSDRPRKRDARPARNDADNSDNDRRSQHAYPDDDRREEVRRLIRKERDRPNRRLRASSTGGGGFGGINAGVGGGIAMMAIAVVWFFVALAAGWIFFYPPILFIIGLIAVVKGLASGDL